MPAADGLPPGKTPHPGTPAIDRDLAALIDEHAEAVFRVANGILRNRSLAEDAVQETMIKAWQSLPRFRGESSLRSWILRIAHNTAISMLRRRRERAVDPVELPERIDSLDPARTTSARADLAIVRGALDALDDLSRTIVVLREVEELSYQEIADTLGVGVPTVKTRLLRARRALQEALHSTEETP